MNVTRPRNRELAERFSNGIHVRLLWRKETKQLWIEVREPDDDGVLAIPVRPEQALDAFRHPYAYAASGGLQFPTESRAGCERAAGTS